MIPGTRVMHQHMAIHRRFVDCATFNQELTDHSRSIIISVTINLRDTIDNIIIPLLEPATAKRWQTALAATDDYISRFAYFQTAAEAILSRMRDPPGPFELGVIGQILARLSEPET